MKRLIFICLFFLPVFAFAADVLDENVFKKDDKYFTQDGKLYTGTFIFEFNKDGIDYVQTSEVKNGVKEGKTFLKSSDGYNDEANFKNNILIDIIKYKDGSKWRHFYFDADGNINKADIYQNNTLFIESNVINDKAVSGICYNGNTKIQMSAQQIADLNADRFKTCIAEPVIITALEIISDFEANGVAANKKYKGKTVIIEGKVSKIITDFYDNPQVFMIPDQFSYSGVRFTFAKSESDSVAQISKGQKIRIQGVCDGVILGDVVIRSSKIVN